MAERDVAPPQGDAVRGRTDAEAEAILGETGALPEESAKEDPAALRAQIADLQAEVGRLRAELATAQQRADDERMARARGQADFENFRKRMLAEQARWQDEAKKAVIDQLLESDDDFDRALQASGDVEALKRGVDLARRRQQEVYRRSGLETIEVAAGTPFDPRLHEAVASVAAPGHADGEVVTVERRGYTFKGTLLRPALVTVAKAQSGRDTQA